MALALSILDQSPVAEGATAGDALRQSIDLAEWADHLGYTRYWVAEHHGTPMLAGTTPEILIGQIAARTRSIRVGSGGVMLPHYSPLKVAEAFNVLGALTPDRIDLAIGRAAGTDPLTAYALQRDRRAAAPDDFPEQLDELLGYVRDGLPPSHRFAKLLRPTPWSPPVWLLGSSPQSGIWAAQKGLPYAFADFINPTGMNVAQQYRREFAGTAQQPDPRVLVAVWALVAETTEEATRLASSAQVAFLQFLAGHPIQIPPVEVALHLIDHRPETLQIFSQRRRAIIGDPARVRAGIEEVAEEYGADEIAVVTITHDHAARRRSYELLAQAFDLSARPV
jgi:luciferase family oxidoreductase group 1